MCAYKSINGKKDKKRVLVIFKTHLDIGFTDYSAEVTEKYLTSFIPNAIRVGNELKNTDTPFVWTVGSWLVWLALKRDKDGSVERAIKEGIIRWHALPFTTHTELMSPKLFEYGLSLSEKLDERFGFKTVGAKMTDVPGHTIGIIPIMKKKGVKFLHIGVNPATPLPPVPKVFRWKCGDDEIRVMYQGDYGTAEDFGDFAVYFAHTGDNAGPQSADDIVNEYKKVREKFPDCDIVAATIDDLAEEVEKMKGLPVFDREIGDSWIHGAGTDPEKVARYRKVLRELEKYDEIPFDLTDNLLCVPEHTWGVNLNIYFHYDKYYSAEELAKMPAEREKMENSWKEQRAYVERAEKLFGVTPDYPVQMPELKGEETDEEIPLEISWQLFDNSDYERYKKVYMRSFVDWAIWDFTKPGLPDYKGGIYVARVDKACKTGEKTTYRLTFENEIAERYGLPTFFVEKQGSHVTVKWQGKKATRFPQAFWLKFKGCKEDWEINKMGKWLRPEDFSGSPLISAVYEGIRNGEVEIKTYDCALVAPFGRRLLQYNVEDKKQDMYFNLYNNIWNTNFPMWYSDDGRFVFEIDTKK